MDRAQTMDHTNNGVADEDMVAVLDTPPLVALIVRQLTLYGFDRQGDAEFSESAVAEMDVMPGYALMWESASTWQPPEGRAPQPDDREFGYNHCDFQWLCGYTDQDWGCSLTLTLGALLQRNADPPDLHVTLRVDFDTFDPSGTAPDVERRCVRRVVTTIEEWAALVTTVIGPCIRKGFRSLDREERWLRSEGAAEEEAGISSSDDSDDDDAPQPDGAGV